MAAPSLRLFLSTLIDYAGLFPPAALDLSAVIAAYEHYSKTPHRWLLGRFVLPLSQLPQFEICLDQLDQQYAAAFWPLSIVLEPSLQALERLAPWLEKQNRFTISALEFKVGGVEAIAPLLPHLPPHSDLFFEVPLDATLSEYLAVLQGTRAAVKVRTGGLTPNDFPSIKVLAQFLIACASNSIPFKATAGLHHPLRSWQPLPNGRFVKMHGFLNMALAAAFAYGYGATVAEIASILEIENPDAFIFSSREIICHSPLWSQEPELSTVAGHLPLALLTHVRSRYFLGIGSCSFQDSLADLDRLGLLRTPSPLSSYAFST
ncbi:hypothetical protein [Leptothoe spongobia]|uniref:Uncharacterized protein n=1 Tax=Leptothoe spongobia TAU-MAC 1115 TaxID=1967444 RepID=A0A947DDZ6_9CYAN|nr:hypothetical protein [Leptothoe spongobia]MBT9314823.1 hypothetical protein [Leptothoe spongobia TAU-MAC 1115]